MTDLVERLRNNLTTHCAIQPTHLHMPDYSAGRALLDEAATALEAQAKEIEALRADLNIVEGAFTDVCDDLGCKYDNEAALEAIYALRERVKELEASSLAAENKKLQTWIDLHRGDTMSLSNEVDHFREELALAEARAETAERELDVLSSSHRDLAKRLASAERERDEARAALKAFLPDPMMMDILWGDMDDEATGTHTVKLKHFRAARAIIED